MSHRRLGVFAVAAVAGLLAVGTAAAATGSGSSSPTHTVQVHDDTEAWYQVLPVSICSTPLGCPPPLPLPVPGPSTIYPAGTLHVGAALGIEISRTYLRPALYSLPAGAVLTGGTATIPIDHDLQAGTINAGALTATACLVTAPVTNGVEGSLEDPPAVNCKVSSKVAVNTKGDALTVDLAPFIAAWHDGKPNNGFALLPVINGLGDLSVWGVAMNGQAAPGPHVSYLITYTDPADQVTPATTPPAVVTAPTPITQPPPVIPPAVTAVAPPAPTPVIAAPSQPVSQVSSNGFKYSAIFLVPLAFLFGLVFLGRTFTRDATPINAAAGTLKRRH